MSRLLRAAGLGDADAFEAPQWAVAVRDEAVVACGRLRPLADGTHELAGVDVDPTLRGRGVGAALVRGLLAQAPGTVVALALAPAFFERLGFRRLAAVPPVLADKAAGACATQPFVPMARGPVVAPA